MKKDILFFLAVIFFSLCSQGQNFIQVDKNNSNQTINIAKNQILEVKLQSAPSSGYIWCLTNSNNGILKQVGIPDFISDNNSETDGSPSTQVTRFAGISEGTFELEMAYMRPWEKDVKPSDVYKIAIVSEGKYTGTYQSKKPIPVKEYKPTSLGKALPTHFSWIEQGGTTPCKDQGACGDCYAFAACGVFEANIKIMDNVTRDLSEQWFVDCDVDQNGCYGGGCPMSHFKTEGCVYEVDFPYLEGESTCGPSYPFHEKISSVTLIQADQATVDILKQKIYDYGPIYNSMHASTYMFNYKGGILTGDDFDSTGTNHAVVLVGWDDNGGTDGYWILRNSWGEDWGENGYVRIKYGISAVGTRAYYINYKGITPHNLPPIADFSASPNSSCTGLIEFSDASNRAPTSWLWTFGDGTTSTLQNPSHTYATSGTYTVTLISTNTNGPGTKTRTNFITINLPSTPTITGASHEGPGSVILSASGNGAIYWYDAITGGNVVNNGTTFITPVLNSTTIYYVENAIEFPQQSAGKIAKSVNGAYYTGTTAHGLIFDALNPFTLKSVTVTAKTVGNRTIYLKNSSGSILNSKSIDLSVGTQTVTLNFNVPKGTDLLLNANSNNNLWRDTLGGTYPYTVPNLLSITGNTVGANGGIYYYFFYDWQVQQVPCLSPRVPVTATINPYSGINENNETNIEIFPNPNNGEFTIVLNDLSNEINKISIENYLGQEVFSICIEKEKFKKIFNFSELPKGIYLIKLSGTEKIIYNKMILN